MGIAKSKSNIQYLNYYLLLEKNLEDIFKYIEPDKVNFKAYSLENAKLLLLIGSEVDILMKEILPSGGNMDQYRAETLRSPDYGAKFYRKKVFIEKYGLEAKSPWINFRNNKNPDWWRAYNNVKHDRFNNFKDANLQNVINALCGLFVIVCFYVSDDKNILGVYYDKFGGNHINDATRLCKI
jgi:hypothetical protein